MFSSIVLLTLLHYSFGLELLEKQAEIKLSNSRKGAYQHTLKESLQRKTFEVRASKAYYCKILS